MPQGSNTIALIPLHDHFTKTRLTQGVASGGQIACVLRRANQNAIELRTPRFWDSVCSKTLLI